MTPDNTTLDARARQAAAGVKDAVSNADLQLFSAGIPALRVAEPSRRRLAGAERWIAAAGAFAAVMVVVGLAVLPGRLFAPDTETANSEATTATSTQPGTGATSIAPNPDGVSPVTVPVIPEDTNPSTTSGTESTTATVAVDTTPPELAILSPADGATVTKGTIQFRGTTEPGATVIAAGLWEADVDAEGNWEIVMAVNSGSNIATFTAIDGAGNETSEQVTFVYDPPSPTTTVPPDDTPFAAENVYGTCAESPPFDVYHGTAPAGTKVTVSSEYGGGNVYANELGQWELKVFFETAPYGVEFPVTVRHVATGQTRVFGFTSLVG